MSPTTPIELFARAGEYSGCLIWKKAKANQVLRTENAQQGFGEI